VYVDQVLVKCHLYSGVPHTMNEKE
jgi:hypothetical protein